MQLNLKHELRNEWKNSLFNDDDDVEDCSQSDPYRLDFFHQVSKLIISFNNDECKDNADPMDDNQLLENKNITIDVSLEQYVPLIRGVLENNHLLLLDSFSRFNPERKRVLAFTVSDQNDIDD